MCIFAQNRFLKCENREYGSEKRHHGGIVAMEATFITEAVDNTGRTSNWQDLDYEEVRGRVFRLRRLF